MNREGAETSSNRRRGGRPWWRRFWGRFRRVAGRGARRRSSRGSWVLETYRGHGCARRVEVLGRVYYQFGILPRDSRGFWSGLRGFLLRWLRWGSARLEVTVEMAGAREVVRTNGEGFFRAMLDLPATDLPDGGWADATVRCRPGKNGMLEAQAPIYLAPAKAEFVVISDLDDTVVATGVGQKLKMFWHLFFEPAETREVIAGVGELYRALHAGAGGDAGNPMLYVSRGPWSIYDILVEFFRLHDIPEGPVLYLRDWGLTLRRPWPRRARAHKEDVIEEIFAIYPDHRFVLLGDSGQKDPELYADFVHRHPGRVAAVYIRDVARGEDRAEAVRALAEELRQTRDPNWLLLTADSVEIGRHAASIGLIAPERIDAIARAQEKAREQPEPS